MMKKPLNFPRLRALYTFKKLSTLLSSDVLADGSIAERFDIPVSRPVQLSKDAVISQPTLFKAFREALAGEAVSPLVDQDGRTLIAEVSIDAEGAGLVKFDGRDLRFEKAGLLASDVNKRAQLLEKAISRHTLLQQEVNRLRATTAKRDFSDDDFLTVIQALQTSPEAFSGLLAPKVKRRQIALGDLLPEETAYWSQLTAPISASSSLPEFIVDELASQRELLLAGDPRKAMKSIALSFCAPALVPIDLFRAQDPDMVLLMLEEAEQFADHFGLVGAVEICGDWLPRDPRFGPAGEQLLDKLFSDAQRLKDTCAIYGAGFVLAAARLHQHQELRCKPAFWRRLTIAAHASLIARAFGASDIDPTSLFKWAMSVSGKAYYLSICIDSADEPRWRHDWLTPNMLVPDAFGRVDAVLRRLPEGVTSQAWVKRVEAARASLEEGGPILANYPAIGESGPRKQPLLDELGELTALYRTFIDTPTLDNFLMAGPLFFSFGIPADCVPPAAKLIAELRQSGPKWDDSKIHSVAMLAIYLAIQLKDVPLADAVAELGSVPT